MKTEEDILKFRSDVLEQMATAAPENVRFLQGVIYGLDWIKKEKEDNFAD